MPLGKDDWDRFRKREVARAAGHRVSDILDGYVRARNGGPKPTIILWNRVIAAIGLLITLVGIGGCVVSCFRH